MFLCFLLEVAVEIKVEKITYCFWRWRTTRYRVRQYIQMLNFYSTNEELNKNIFYEAHYIIYGVEAKSTNCKH